MICQPVDEEHRDEEDEHHKAVEERESYRRRAPDLHEADGTRSNGARNYAYCRQRRGARVECSFKRRNANQKDKYGFDD